MNSLEEEFYVCSCSATAISLSRYKDDPIGEIHISMWEQGISARRDSWWERLRHIWHIIRKGHPFEDYLILSQEDAVSLTSKLNEWTNRTTGTSGGQSNVSIPYRP